MDVSLRNIVVSFQLSKRVTDKEPNLLVLVYSRNISYSLSEQLNNKSLLNHYEVQLVLVIVLNRKSIINMTYFGGSTLTDDVESLKPDVWKPSFGYIEVFGVL